MVAATQFGRRLFPENVVCNDAEQVSGAVRRTLDDGEEKWPPDFAPGHTHLVILSLGRVVPVSPADDRAAVVALLRPYARVSAACDACRYTVGPVAGLLPVPAGSVVAALALCANCFGFYTYSFPSSYFITSEN